MNDKLTSITPPDDEAIARKLTLIAQQTDASREFAAELERKLRTTHRSGAGWFSRRLPQMTRMLGWVALMVFLALVLSWSIKSLIPTPQPSGNATPSGYVCQVTQPNGSLPPGTQTSKGNDDPNLYGNGQLWTRLKPDGKAYLSPENQRTDGSFEMTWPWYLGVQGPLTIEGRRLDAQAVPLQYELSEPFNNFQGSTLIFPTTGCWVITGHAGDASLTFVTEIILDTGLATPTPIVTPHRVTDGNPTVVVDQGDYDWRESKLYLNVPLPPSPGQANVYSLKDSQPATVDSALAKAREFGVEGSVFQVPGQLANQIGFMVTDGKQRVYVQSNMDYSYYADYGAYPYMSGSRDINDDQAATIIDGFMKSHGLNFPYKIENPHINPGMYYVLPTTPDGMPIYHDYNMPARLELTVDQNGQVTLMSAYQVDYEAQGTYAIHTSEEAFQQILDQSNGMQNGVMEIMRSAGGSEAGFWARSYPDGQTITIYGQPASYPAAQAGGEPYVGIGQFTAIGNTSGVESIDPSTYIEATGQFMTENGIRKFNVDSWKVTDAEEAYPNGSLRQEGDRVLLTAEDGSGEYVIEDAPAGLPFDMPDGSYLAVHGLLKGGQLHWDTINYYPAGSGGGGGGGNGTGFHKLNLSGTPVPFPTPTGEVGVSTTATEYIVKEGDTCGSIATSFNVPIRSIVSVNNLHENCLIKVGDVLKIPASRSSLYKIGQRIEGVRGILMVTIHKLTDGTQRVEYGLYPKPDEAPFYFATLYGNDVQKLEAYHNHLIDIWGEVAGIDPNGMPQITLERYEIPYPDLQFQILTGKQKATELEGERVALFTTSSGTTYVQLTSNGFPDITIPGTEGSDVYLQVLAIPEETFGGYPALRVFDAAVVVNPKDGQPTEFTGSADKPNIVDESVQPGPENYVPPELTIESVELVYYVPDPRTGRQGTGSDEKILQPAWRFYGHYSDSSEVEFLVQALKEEFLLPELAPYTGPG